MRLTVPRRVLVKSGPYIGPRGGKWADARHTIAWKDEAKPRRKRQAPAEDWHPTFDTHGDGAVYRGMEIDVGSRTARNLRTHLGRDPGDAYERHEKISAAFAKDILDRAWDGKLGEHWTKAPRIAHTFSKVNESQTRGDEGRKLNIVIEAVPSQRGFRPTEADVFFDEAEERMHGGTEMTVRAVHVYTGGEWYPLLQSFEGGTHPPIRKLAKSKFPVGAIRKWKDGGSYQKQADGSWRPVATKAKPKVADVLRDGDGGPLTLYQANDASRMHTSPSSGSEYGIFLSPVRKYAALYGGNVHKTWAKLANPLVVEGKHEISPSDLTKDDIDKLKARGYDAIIVKNDGEPHGKASEVVVFDASSLIAHGDLDTYRKVKEAAENARYEASLSKSKFPAGTVHTWADGNDYRKDKDGEWKPVARKSTKLVVYRVEGTPGRGLDNCNAGNAAGIATFLLAAGPGDGGGVSGHGNFLSAYEVDVGGKMGGYVRFRDKEPWGRYADNTTKVGVSKMPGGEGDWNPAWYSFPKGADWKAKRIKTIDLRDLPAYRGRASTWDYKKIRDGIEGALTSSDILDHPVHLEADRHTETDLWETVRKVRRTGGWARADMPQIRKDYMPEFLAGLERKGVKVERTTMRAQDITPSQGQINMEGIRQMMEAPEKVLARPVLVAQDGSLLDGHHRWAAVHAHDKRTKMKVIRVDLSMRDLMEAARNSPGAQSAGSWATDASVRSSIKRKLGKSITFAKGRGYPVGTVRTRKDGDYRKQANGEWRRVSGEAKQKQGELTRKYAAAWADFVDSDHWPGNCYEAAARALLAPVFYAPRCVPEGSFVMHGLVTNGLYNAPMGHSWVETPDGMVLDATNGFVGTKEAYAKAAGPDYKELAKYSETGTKIMVVREETWGPWDPEVQRVINEADNSTMERIPVPKRPQTRSAGEVMRAVLDRAVEIAKERRMGAPALNDGGFDALISQAFKELNPPEFASREDLDAQQDQETDFAQLRAESHLDQIRRQREGKIQPPVPA